MEEGTESIMTVRPEVRFPVVEKEECQTEKKMESLVLDELIDEYQPEAYRYSVLLMGNREDAWDLLQETWIQVYKKLSHLQDPSCFKSWFYRILTRNGWRMKKKQKREIPVEDIFEQYEPEKEDSSEEHFFQIERRELLMEQINCLRPKLKTVVLLYYYNDFSIEEISKITGSPKATVKSRLFQARKQLKTAIEQDEDQWR
ncbi:MAG: RNA polymerase sigma factor [Lachnospiraceae bacterium]|nr:RNA polymerase sigma factor [Lachnospiraceae bacterium]